MQKFVAALFAAVLTFSALPAVAAVTGVVRGIVLVNNAPQANAHLTLRGEDSLLQTNSDSSGNYIFSQVPFGSYTLTVSYASYPDQSAAFTVTSDAVVTMNFALGQLRTIANLAVTSHGGVTGTPVSGNVLGRQQIAALPTNNSLDRIVETVPGIVRFSYNEPVAHGFHGVTYELDGAPLPQATSSNFAEIMDPKNIDSLEIFTGAIPAEYGGSRIGGVVNILTNRFSDLTVPEQGSFTVGGGNLGQAITTLNNAVKTGKTEVFLTASSQTGTRGLDTPNFRMTHDTASQSNQFFRVLTNFNDRQSLAFDFSNQLAQFQIPFNTDPNSIYDPTFYLPSTDDVQREYDRLASLNFTSVSSDGNTVFQVIPWVRFTRIAYDGDLPNDVRGLTNIGTCSDLGFTDPTCTANPDAIVYQSNIGLQQNRTATYTGVRSSLLVTSRHDAFKVGLDLSREFFKASQLFACYDPSCSTTTYTFPLPPAPAPGYTGISSSQAQTGSQVGLYVEDKWTPTQRLSVSYGLRYDASSGYTGGNQVSPRLGVNFSPNDRDVVHAYYGRFYAAPQLEDVRQDCVVLQGCPTTPIYDLQPETDSYAEVGIAHTFSPHLSGYVNAWTRNANNVLDTTQLLNTPLFAVFNNTIGRAHGYELRLQGTMPNTDSWFISGTWSSSKAAGISGSTFLFPPTPPTPGSLVDQLQPEDHDQTVAANAAFTHRFGYNKTMYSTLQAEYGTGYPVAFEGITAGGPISFEGRLPSHTTLNWSLGRDAGRNGDHSIGFDLNVDNVLNHQYVIKIANGFNTTQISNPRSVLFRITQPF